MHGGGVGKDQLEMAWICTDGAGAFLRAFLAELDQPLPGEVSILTLLDLSLNAWG
jgi:hypothetical protein